MDHVGEAKQYYFKAYHLNPHEGMVLGMSRQLECSHVVCAGRAFNQLGVLLNTASPLDVVYYYQRAYVA